MIKTCVICGKKYEANVHNTQYCSDECRAEHQRRRIRLYRERKSEELNQIALKAQSARNTADEEARQKRLAEQEARIKANDPYELMLKAQSEGDWKAYFTQYQRYMLMNNKIGYVNMIPVTDDNFVQAVMNSIEAFGVMHFHQERSDDNGEVS